MLLTAWFAVSNHCALALLEHDSAATAYAKVHRCCADQPSGKGEQPAPVRNPGLCCKSLRLLPLEAAAKLVKAPDLIALFAIEWLAFVDRSGTEPNAPEARSRASPPRATSFAERVLQQSLPGNAPPIAA